MSSLPVAAAALSHGHVVTIHQVGEANGALARHADKADKAPGVQRTTGRITLHADRGAVEFRDVAVKHLDATGS